MSSKVDNEQTHTPSPAERSRRRRRMVLSLLVVAVMVPAVYQLVQLYRRTSTPPERELVADVDPAAKQTAHKHTNQLIHETSPYLLQHAHNPVNWYSWGPEALAKAKKENKPIFLSVGYSTCYWCHVMEKESFEDEEVAKILNEHFICIKVDREERPDIDEQYMLATQLVTGRGGWPNSVWLTPDGRPWMAGTYFPKARFMDLLGKLADYWTNRRDEVEQQADRLAEAIRRIGGGADPAANRPVSQQLLDRAVTQLRSTFDAANGGFGARPKFPPHGSLAILIHEYRRSNDEALLAPITRTLDAMWLGGMHDHVGGGFHRYATDSIWLLPHFEKMLYDNAQLMRAYTDGYLLTKTPRYREAVEDIFFWVTAEMTSPQGAFYSAIDSGEVGKEGETYVWHYKEVMEVLGEEDGALFTEVYNIAERGNFHEEATGEATGTNIVHLSKPLADIANERGQDAEAFKSRLAEMRKKLLNRRNTWVQPHKDDKVLTSWNGLMIGSLAYAGRQLDEPRYTAAAAKAAEFILDALVDDRGRLLRTYRDGRAKLPGYLDDYAYLAQGLIELHRATGSKRWLDEAQRLADVMLAEFEDKQDGAFYFTADVHDDLLLRSKNLSGGGNVPSANGVTALVLIDLTRLTGERRYADAAKRTLDALSGLMWQNPRAADSEVLAAGDWLAFANRDEADPSAATKDAARPAPPQPKPTSAPDARKANAPVTAQAFASRRRVRPGDTFHVAVALDIEEGWHLYGPNPDADFLVPTTVAVNKNDVLAAGMAVVPEATKKQDPVLKQVLATYEGRIWFLLPVTVSADADAGETTVELTVKTQACDASRCLPPRTDTLTIPIVVDPAAPPGASRHDTVFGPLLGRIAKPTGD